MKKFTLFIASLFLTMGAMAQAVEFTFTRGEGTAATVTATEGVTATIETNVAWLTNGKMGERADVLCPNRNTSQASGDNFITFTLTIGGLPQGREFTAAKFTHVAVNSGGNLQPSNDVDIRHCNFTLTANDTEVATLTDQNIWIPSGQTERVVALEGTSFTADAEGNLVLVLKLAKGTTNNGCFYGLTKIRLTSPIAELQEVVDAANDFLSGWAPTVGHITTENKATIEAAIADANTAITTGEGVAEAQTALQNALNGPFETILPEEGKCYTLVSACEADASRLGQTIYVNNDGGMQFSNSDDMGKVFQFVEAGEGKFYLYNVERGTYLNTAKGHGAGQNSAVATTTDEAKAVVITNLGRTNVVKIVPEGGAMLHAQVAGSSVVGWNAAENTNVSASAWTIVEKEVSLAEALSHTLTVSEAGWSTLVLGYNAAIPTEVKAYAVSSLAEGKAVLTEVEGTLPAHTPVLIEAAAGDYTFNYTDEEATVESNLLAGATVNTYIAPVEGTTNYVLSNNNDIVGLYKKTVCNVDRSDDDDAKDEEGKVVENINDHITFAANKAYLPVVVEAEGAPAMFSLGRGEGTTSIEQVAADAELVIYDLAGRRVEKMEKGIYIVNGKKVVK